MLIYSGRAEGTRQRYGVSPHNREWRRWDSNPRPPACKAGALPAELRPLDLLVGLAGIEPATSALSVLRSNRLSYSPLENK